MGIVGSAEAGTGGITGLCGAVSAGDGCCSDGNAEAGAVAVGT